MTKELRITLSDEEYAKADGGKGDRTWKEVLLDGATRGED